jgi:PAS domain S-box-containing protein
MAPVAHPPDTARRRPATAANLGMGADRRQRGDSAPPERRLNVLVAESCRADADRSAAELERAGLRPVCIRAETRKEFLDGLTGNPGLIVCDHLPGFDARKALTLLAERSLAIPLIVVTETINEEVAVECMKRGASDYLRKDRISRLGPAALEALEQQALRDDARRVEDELEQRAEHFRQLVEQLPVVVYMWEAGADGQCYYVSPAIESLLGYPVGDWLADPSLWAKRLHPEDRDRVVAYELYSRTSGEDFLAEYRMFARDGRVVWIRDEAIMVRREDGGMDHLQGLMHDVTVEKEVQLSLRRSREETIRRLARAAEFRDDETGAHIERVGRYCELIARRLGLDSDRCERLRIASPMHDVGKIGVPDAVLLKPGPLNADERAEMERHATIGYQILSGSGAELLDLAAIVAWTHHERFDGGGYPCGLAGDEIPLEGRIAAVADVFDALTNHRIYRPAFPYSEAIATMRTERGAHFDPRVLDAFLSAEHEIKAIIGSAEIPGD